MVQNNNFTYGTDTFIQYLYNPSKFLLNENFTNNSSIWFISQFLD